MIASCPICFEKKPKTFHFECGHSFCSSCAALCSTCPVCNSSTIRALPSTQTERKDRIQDNIKSSTLHSSSQSLASSSQSSEKDDAGRKTQSKTSNPASKGESKQSRNPKSTENALWKAGDPFNKGMRSNHSDVPFIPKVEPKLSYLAALKRPTVSSSSLTSASASGKSAPLPVASSSRVPAPVPPTKKKNKPSEKLQIDLLQMALDARKKEEERKRAAMSGTQHLKSRNTGMDEKPQTGPVAILRGKVRPPGEQARRKNRLSSLKKSILHERRARWWLAHPESKPFPLIVHPSLIEHNCVWLVEDDHTTPPMSEAVPFIQQLSPAQNNKEGALFHDDDEETQESEGQEESEEQGSEEVTDNEEDNSYSSSEEEPVKPKVDSSNDKRGTIPFDASLASPVYFGASFTRHQQEIEVNVPSSLEGEKSTTQKARTPSLPLTRPVRDYVNQALSKELDEVALGMIGTLFKFQERARADDPIKAKLRRRLVMGLHEVRRGVKSRRCVCVIVAPNIEDVSRLDEKVNEILHLCSEKPEITQDDLWEPTPVIFALNKRSLARAVGKRSSVSCIGIYSADGAYEQFKLCLSLAKSLSEFWHSQVETERKQALQGKQPICGNCQRLVLEPARRDCLHCLVTYCEPCAASRTAKVLPCPVRGDSKEQDGKAKTCQIVRVARTPPQPVLKSLNAKASEFVPMWLQQQHIS